MARSKFHIDEDNILDQEPSISKSKPEKTKKPISLKSAPEKKKVGRPKVKVEETKTINIAVPVSVIEKINIAKCKYHDNLTEYVNAVINADLANNMKEYQKIYNMLN